MRGDVPPRMAGRPGFTTGACAAAASRAATLHLLLQVPQREVEVLLPDGKRYTFAVHACEGDLESATAVIIKDGGSGPDVTHQAHIRATVRRLPDAKGIIRLEGGEGVGRVSRPGLPVAVGEAAINPTPRRNILENVQEVADSWLDQHGLLVTLSVANGELLARRTLNPRLGILGGISILGISGIAHPYSTSAFKATVVQGIQAAKEQQAPAVVLTTGGRAERYAMDFLPQLPGVAFVQMGDFVGAALQALNQHPLPRVILVAMPGKLVKIAEGRPNTHASKGTFNRDFLVDLALAAGFQNREALQKINTVAHGVEILATVGLEKIFCQHLVAATQATLLHQLPPHTRVGVVAFTLEGALLAHTGEDAWNLSAG
ncbi:MAG: cobalt-precorrin-5B (C(1))-methyltransferase [Magnetococcales bacterium]|nr:cobalt-precorrin-5B (C(1))-methyltransferase [Magnetococcales bacterium]NGZ28801.1 cobalt-precorrin-5B (C(1))-methyltransferase [Magnetococcales bacterium]